MKAPTMGMDVYGKKPTAEIGEYFRNNIWHWHPLADLCQALAPDITKACDGWHYNDGDGLDADAATALAAVLEQRLADGTVKMVIRQRKWRHPLQARQFPCTEENVSNFAAFLKASGGFEIH